jgi:hypothetical protein
MRITLLLIIIFTFFSCNERTKAVLNEIDKSAPQIKVYKSNNDSFRKDFFIKIEDEKAIVYGWFVNASKDTIYYRSKSKLEKGKEGKIKISLEKYELTKTRLTKENLDHFKNDTKLNLPEFSTYSSFIGQVSSKDLYKLNAFKQTYFSRFDEFIFVRVK